MNNSENILFKGENMLKKIAHFIKKKLYFNRKVCSSVDRASDSDSESQGFESLHAYGIRC